MWVAFLILLIFIFLFRKLKGSKDGFWERYNVPQVYVGGFKSTIEIFLGRKTLAELDSIVYSNLGRDKFVGFIQMKQPTILIKDLSLVKRVLIKDFEYFTDRRMAALSSGQNQKIFNKMIARLQGEEWKGVRNSLSPAFSTGKIRKMMEYFNKVSIEWVDHFEEELKNSKKDSVDFNMQKEVTAFTVDVIALAGFGMNAGTIRNPNSYFYQMALKLTKFTLSQLIKFGLSLNFPTLVKVLGISVIDNEAMAFFEEIIEKGMKARMNGEIKANDFLQLVAELRNGEDERPSKNYFEDENVAKAQALGFFFGGFSTTSNFIGFVLYLLALNQDVQEKLRDEVNEKVFTEGDGAIDYDKLMELEYMDMVLSEVLRKYPQTGRIQRTCSKDYYLPEENLRIPKGAVVAIPLLSIHNDEEFYEYPDKFYPEHFSRENKARRRPYAFLTFGSGPRNCLGMRFVLVESKAVISYIIHNFIIEPSPKTPVPVKVKNVAFGVEIPNDLELRIRKVGVTEE